MKSKTLFLINILFLPLLLSAQLSDTSLIKRLTINGSCLCQTTLTKLKETNADLKPVDVEEMDLPKKCLGQDSRYIAGTGFSTIKQPGIIFQKDPESDLISKVRLTDQFKGNFPDGRFIDLSSLRLKDLFKFYPQFKEKWGSRDCSDYWKFSNDTISFYVKIDPRKQPQFPIDEAYYLDKPVVAVDLVMSCSSIQKDKTTITIRESNDPIFFIDSVRVKKEDLQNYEPSNIAAMTVFKDSSAIARGGIEAKNGLIYIETKRFAKDRYWNYFRLKSPQYAKLVPLIDSDISIQYILNKKVLKENYEGDLSSINDKVFKGIQIISKKQLKKEYGITDKDFGVIITSDVPANLHNGKSKF